MKLYEEKTLKAIKDQLSDIQKNYQELSDLKYIHAQQPKVLVARTGRTDQDKDNEDIRKDFEAVLTLVEDLKDHYEDELRDKEEENDKALKELEEKAHDPFSYSASDTVSKRAILEDLFNNCTVQELEALELLVRIKKGRQYLALRAGLIHPDHVDVSIVLNAYEECQSKKGNVYGRFKVDVSQA